MDKKSILIIGVSVLVVGLWMLVVEPLIKGTFGKKPNTSPTVALASPTVALASPSPKTEIAQPKEAIKADQNADKPSAKAVLKPLSAPSDFLPQAPDSEKSYSISTEVLIATFTNRGGEITSFKLLNHKDEGEPVEMILKGTDDSYAFGLSFGDAATQCQRELMNVERIDDYTIEFWRDFLAPAAGGGELPFRLKKRFSFKPNEYLFEVSVNIENSQNAVPNIGMGGSAYTLFFGPQLGPSFKSHSKNSDTRKRVSFSNGKKQGVKAIAARSIYTLKDRAVWTAIVGKYFSLIAIPDATNYSISYNGYPMPGIDSVAQLSLTRPPVNSSITADTFRFYIGPNQANELERYDDPSKNGFGYSKLNLSKVIDYNAILGWLEYLMKKIMIFFHYLIPNWGVAIILLTILVKALFFPLTLKGSVATAKMAELQPKMAELQAKYKDKPEKLNAEMAEFYKREGYNPLSGCLPMLVQIPIFFAMYELFNTHFDLRGAMFIPGWIPDLSQPDMVYALKFNLLPFFGLDFSAIRLLPVIYVISQLLYGKYTQTTQAQTGQNATQMKIMMYGMPILFFFILYNSPSGLLVYWIASNVLTIVQQVITNGIMHKKKMNAAK